MLIRLYLLCFGRMLLWCVFCFISCVNSVVSYFDYLMVWFNSIINFIVVRCYLFVLIGCCLILMN